MTVSNERNSKSIGPVSGLSLGHAYPGSVMVKPASDQLPSWSICKNYSETSVRGQVVLAKFNK